MRFFFRLIHVQWQPIYIVVKGLMFMRLRAKAICLDMRVGGVDHKIGMKVFSDFINIMLIF